ncbi:SH3 domain-containing protein [Nisaea sp.]|uniref:SH3 domain-containing protein n=1 Tax=Nisaea sp. TaxID=2024842 RepID=UPI0032EEF65D
MRHFFGGAITRRFIAAVAAAFVVLSFAGKSSALLLKKAADDPFLWMSSAPIPDQQIVTYGINILGTANYSCPPNIECEVSYIRASVVVDSVRLFPAYNESSPAGISVQKSISENDKTYSFPMSGIVAKAGYKTISKIPGFLVLEAGIKGQKINSSEGMCGSNRNISRENQLTLEIEDVTDVWEVKSVEFFVSQDDCPDVSGVLNFSVSGAPNGYGLSTIAVENIRVREAPPNKFYIPGDVVGAISKGDTVQVIGRKNYNLLYNNYEWLQVVKTNSEGGIESGWVFNSDSQGEGYLLPAKKGGY